ncbi:MAG: hypothetical protein ABIZ09_12125 [Rhodoferax sp.]
MEKNNDRIDTHTSQVDSEVDSRGEADVFNSHLGVEQSHHPLGKKADNKGEPETSRGPRGYGHSHAYGGALGYQDETLRTPDKSGQTHIRSDYTKSQKIE